ncbi:MAG TPA: GGDEF domain-containing protein [Solirubrobacterales bacterium]|nr:GGDEF domain-containing protein [Solirubrobacterales bacterium]
MESGGSHDDFETRFWLRTAAAGSWVTVLMSLAGLLYLAFFSDSAFRLGLELMLALALASGLLSLFVLPWRRVVASPWREQAFLCWGLVTVVMIWFAALVDRGGDSPLQFALFLPVVFASLAFPVRYVIATGILAEVAFLSLALEGGLGGGYVLVFGAALAGTAAMALWQSTNHASWRRELARSSTTDPLTHLLNRRGFAMASEQAFAALTRHGRPVTLAVLDLDHLKAYNDEHGHHAGDDLLRWAGERLAASVRGGDAVARLGGDEFAVLLPDTGAEAAGPVIARLSAALAERAPHCLGIASAPDQGISFDDLYRNADTLLYQRKLMRPGRVDGPPAGPSVRPAGTRVRPL